MKRMGKWIMCLAVLCLVLTLVPVEGWAAEYRAAGTYEKNITWVLTDDGTLTLSGTGMVTGGSTPRWWNYKNDIVKLVVEEGITCLHWVDFPNLASVELPDTMLNLGWNAFTGCTALTEITLPASILHMDDNVFRNCTALEKVIFEGHAPTFSEEAFNDVDVTLYYPGNDETWTEEVLNGYYGTGNVTWVAYERMWEIPEPEPQEVTVVDGGAHTYGISWELLSDGTLTVSGPGTLANTYDVPWEIYESQIKKVIVEEGVTGEIRFGRYISLESITLPSTLQKIVTLQNCPRLKELVVPSGITSLPDLIVGCTGLERFVVDPGNRKFSSVDGMLLSKDGTVLLRCPEGREGEVTIPDSVTVAKDAFRHCRKVTGVTIPNSVTELDGTFYDCDGLKEIVIPDSVTRLYAAFSQCDGLTEVTVPGSVSTTGVSSFHSCTALEKVIISEGVEEVDSYAFMNCTNLREVVLPDSLKTIDNDAFSGCASLESLTIPANVKTIRDSIFGEESNVSMIVFTGNAPYFWNDSFLNVTATAVYPAGNDTWTEEKRQDYCGNITWVTENCEEHTVVIDEAVAATCISTGLTEGSHCGKCGAVLVKQEEIPLTGHTYEGRACVVCGDLLDVIETMRLAGDNRFETAFAAADAMKSALGVEKFDAVVVASGMNFADALSGSYLAAVKDAPILLASGVDGVDAQVKDYIKENLNPGGTVYILGGTGAVPEAFESGLDGFTVERLAGGNRFETNLMVLEEAGVGDKPVLVCTGLSFADSLSASAAELPILLVWNDLTDGQKGLLDSLNGNKLYIIGGESAVGESMEKQLTAYGEVERVAGGNRFETSVAIAEKFFEAPESAVLAYAWNFPDGLCGGSLAAAMDAPLILTMDNFEAKAAEYVQGSGIWQGTVLGGTGLISENAVETIFGLN